MGIPTRQQEVLEELRRQIRRMERRPARREGVLACGRPEVEALLPGGGFPRGALSSIRGGPASGKTAVALATLRQAQAEGGLAAFVDGRGELYPPAALALGVDLSRLLIVRPERSVRTPRGGQDVLPGLWAAEVLLASGAFPAVVIDVSLVSLHGDAARRASRAEPVLRRLRAAAEKGGSAALLLAGRGEPVIPAVLRVDLDAVRPGPVLRAMPAAMPVEAGHAA